ncbi:hypothetical protein GI374_16675 [Paracoccus sp. S-4012]|uniref:hypothetical protein n=1 Tax=Paracoccus sp. S-4012 TaxID=2665648 RepID=UPI0012B0CCC2|nr:hypothetical protein [Paracoccus sp. S-4012]MRX52014.1 hypothetical protein [Paracoccus sp. S-4012]
MDAIVLESMATQPEYLWASERYLVHATHAVITNLRPDRTRLTEAMSARSANTPS